MTHLRTFLTRLAPSSPLLDSGFCVCGCEQDAHTHWRPGTDCGRCGIDICPARDPAELAAVYRDDQAINPVLADDNIDRALQITDDGFVTLAERLFAAGRPR